MSETGQQPQQQGNFLLCVSMGSDGYMHFKGYSGREFMTFISFHGRCLNEDHLTY